MNLNKLTEKAQESVLAAQKLAETLGHAQIEPEHLLISLLEQQDGVAPAVLRKMNADPADLARVMRSARGEGSRYWRTRSSRLPARRDAPPLRSC